ncbi:MAG: class I SAM-dependent methyltransferase, partial [Deltaproteobacteria bacterium]|nr:class I SAM-dependent methyltransferase [Deltaproteobacteria bacterium]
TADVSRCRGCGLVQTRPRLSEEALSTFYDQGYTEFLEGYDPDGRGADWHNDYRLTVIRKVHPLGPEDRLLDVGCNQGQLLRRAVAATGCRATGLDVNAAALARGGAKGGVDYVEGRPGAAPGLEGRRFSVVTLYQVLEHTTDPVGFLRATREYLDDDGILVVEVPDYGAFWRPLFGRLWASLMLPQHTLHFDAASLAMVVREAGYGEVLYHRPMFFPISFTGSLGLVLRERLGIPPEGALGKLLMGLAWLFVDLPAELVLRLVSRTWIQVLIARRGSNDAP